jgi:hypothetical protein
MRGGGERSGTVAPWKDMELLDGRARICWFPDQAQHERPNAEQLLTHSERKLSVRWWS